MLSLSFNVSQYRTCDMSYNRTRFWPPIPSGIPVFSVLKPNDDFQRTSYRVSAIDFFCRIYSSLAGIFCRHRTELDSIPVCPSLPPNPRSDLWKPLGGRRVLRAHAAIARDCFSRRVRSRVRKLHILPTTTPKVQVYPSAYRITF